MLFNVLSFFYFIVGRHFFQVRLLCPLRCPPLAHNGMAAWRSGGIYALPFKSALPAAVAPNRSLSAGIFSGFIVFQNRSYAYKKFAFKISFSNFFGFFRPFINADKFHSAQVIHFHIVRVSCAFFGGH
jgi:hypothetical protein